MAIDMHESRYVSQIISRAEELGARCILPTDATYDDDRLLFNRFHDLHPAALIQTRHRGTVAEVVRLAASLSTPLAIRGGGHHIAGFASCDGGIVMDFSPFRRVIVDEEQNS